MPIDSTEKSLRKNICSKTQIFLPLHLEKIVLWCNGSTTDSGSVCLGSNPGGTATYKGKRFIFNCLLLSFIGSHPNNHPNFRPPPSFFRFVGIDFLTITKKQLWLQVAGSPNISLQTVRAKKRCNQPQKYSCRLYSCSLPCFKFFSANG